jgi:FkbM family methyltransferase
MQLSYAQRLEDYHLDLVFAGQQSGFYIDVGGGHPVADNVSFWFYLKGWRGLVVEPQRALAEMYAAARPRDIVACTLVGNREGEADFHVVERLHGLSTAVESNAKAVADFGAHYTTKRVPVRSLASLTSEHAIASVDFLKIDVEGAEADVLAGADWKLCRPRVVVIEAVAPGSMAEAWHEWEPMLLAHGYRYAFFDGLNRFYVADEASDLLTRFPSEPAAWDAVQHLWDFGRALDRPDHPDHALTRRLVDGFLASLPGLDHSFLAGLLERGKSSDANEAPDALARLLFGTAEYPGVSPRPGGKDAADVYARLMDSDRFRSALARIASAYDGGHLME